ncbi:MAG: sialate O-acetylesterase [Phycisphaeraceae bacterium]
MITRLHNARCHPGTIATLFAVAVLAAAPTGHAGHFDVYILTGQSNALGTTALENADPDAYGPGEHAADTHTLLFWSNVKSTNAAYPPALYGDSDAALSTLAPQQGDGGANPVFWGPEFGFARTLYDADLEDGSRDAQVLIIKATRGGGGNSLWDRDTFDSDNSGGHMWGHVRDSVDAGLAALAAQGHTFDVAGVLYLQGESNSSAQASVAGARLDAFYRNLQAFIHEDHPGKAHAMRLVVAEIAGIGSSTNRQRTANQHKQLAQTHADYSFVPTSDLPLKRDNIHFGNDEKREIGRRMALAAVGMDPLAGDGTLAITNPSFETAQALSAVGSNPPAGWERLGNGLFHANAATPNQSLNDFGGAYADDTNGLDGEELAFGTSTGGIAGDGLAQTLGAKPSDGESYRLTVGVGDRNFYTRFAGVTLELRLADDTPLGSRFFDTNDLLPLFTDGGATARGEVVDVSAQFVLGDVDNTQRLRIAIIAGGATSAPDGGDAFGQSLDIDYVRLARVLPGDTDDDGDIDDTDLGTAFSQYTGPVGQAGARSPQDGDTDADHDVDDTDLGTMFSGYTGPNQPLAVPEPGGLLAFCLAGVFAYRPPG